MSDETERQLEAFGRTLASQAGEEIRPPESAVPAAARRPARRWWALGGAAACVVAVVAALAVASGRSGDDPAASLPVPTTSPFLVPADPLALERDGWTLVQRTTEPFAFAADELPCPTTLDQFVGVGQVHDIVTPPDIAGLDVDINVLEVGSRDRGDLLTEGIQMIGRCIDEQGDVAVESTSLSSIRATWFRAGPDFALATIVGDGGRSIVLEIEGAVFTDSLVADLAHRADQFLRGVEITGAPGDPPVPTTTIVVGTSDPLALESVRWTVSVPDTSPFRYDAGALPVECPVAQRIEGFNGTSRAAYEAELGAIRMDLSILDLGSPERASEFAEAFLLLEPCLVEAVDGAAAVTSLSSIRASWVRVGLDLAVGTVVGADGDVVLFAVERGPFSDDLIADIAHRADQYLRGDEVVGSWPAGAVPLVLNVHCGIGWLGHDGETWTIDGGSYRPVPPEWAALMDRTVRPDDLPLVLVDDGDVLRLTGGGLTIEFVPAKSTAPACE